MHRLLLIGLNHTTAPLDVRERLALDSDAIRAAMAEFLHRFPGGELVALSTCNRVELYAARPAHGHHDAAEPLASGHSPRTEDLVDFLAKLHGVAPESFAGHLYQKTDREVAEHLFAVASSLDSMVLGETQILGQVRQAYELANAAGATGALLNPLFQRALAVAKQVMHTTGLAVGRASVARVAVDYARRVFERFDDKTVLCIGAGKMATLILENLTGLAPGRLLICNRDPVKAAALAQRFGGVAAPMEQLGEHLVAADIVLTSTGATQPIITRSQVESLRKARRYRPMFFIDIAVPRDVDPAVTHIENVYLCNLDHLQQVVAATQEQRGGAVAAAEKIVAEHVEQFATWHRQRALGPVIDRLFERYHAMARQEVERSLARMPALEPAQREQIEQMARRLVNKLLHEPILSLRHNQAPPDDEEIHDIVQPVSARHCGQGTEDPPTP